jgi:hypothetical protein
MPEAILTPRATLKWPSRHKHRVYCDTEEALLNIGLDENSNSHGGDTRDVEFGLHFAKSFMGENRGESESEDSSSLVRLLGLPSPLPDEEGLTSEK